MEDNIQEMNKIIATTCNENTAVELDTIQKAHKLNHVEAVGKIGPGQAYHNYRVTRIDGDTKSTIANITFQTGALHDENAVPGVCGCDLLEIVRHTYQGFQSGEFACKENQKVLDHIEEALLWINKRTEDRAARGVLGTYSK